MRALYYQEQGAGGPLVLAHGCTGAGQMWANLVPASAERYRVIVPDLRGHGRSAGAVALLLVGSQHLNRTRTLTLVGGTYAWDLHYRAYLRQRMAECEAEPGWVDQQRQRNAPVHGDDHWWVLVGKLRDVHDGLDELPFGAQDLAGIASSVLVVSGERDPFFRLRVTTSEHVRGDAER